MGYFSDILITFSIAATSSGQCLSNGGFEEIVEFPDSPEDDRPLNWIKLHGGTINLECFPFTLHSFLTEDAHSGQYAMAMETIECNQVGSGIVQRAGGVMTGDWGVYTPYDFAQVCAERPDYLQFFYKLDAVEGDSGYVSVLQFNYDTITPGLQFHERIDTISYTEGFLFDEPEYTLKSIPLVYLSEENPSFISIIFGSGYRCMDGNCNPGTKLWVDDISVVEGPVGLENVLHLNDIQVYPNPTINQVRIIGDIGKIQRLLLFNHQGQLVLEPKIRSVIDVSQLPKGLYLL